MSQSQSFWQTLSTPFSRYRRKRQEKRRFRETSREGVFQWIYDTNKWGSEDSRSGKGSDMPHSELLRATLPDVLTQLSVHSILDLPCGDMNWISTLDLDRYEYIGADIVPTIIEENREKFPSLQFEILDVCESVLPTADLLMSRDLLVHLCFRDIELALENIFASSFTYFACTTFPEITTNKEKLTGNHRMLNMSLAPFNFGEPHMLVADGARKQSSGKAKKLGVWRVSTLRALYT